MLNSGFCFGMNISRNMSDLPNMHFVTEKLLSTACLFTRSSIWLLPCCLSCPLRFRDRHTACPPTRVLSVLLPHGGCDPVLLPVPGTGAPSPFLHPSPPLAALHLHPLTPIMPSPRSQTSHTARYPTATHRPSKSGGPFVSRCGLVSLCGPPPLSLRPAW